MFKHHARLLNFFLAVGDLVLTVGAFLGAFQFRFHSGVIPPVYKIPELENYLVLLGVILPLWAVLFSSFKLYKSRRSDSVFADAQPLLLSIGTGVLLISAFTFFYRETTFSRLTVVLFGALNFALIFVERIIIRSVLHFLRQRGYNQKRVLIVGAGDLGLRVAQTVQRHPKMGYQIIGFVDDYLTNGIYKQDYGLEILGRTAETVAIADKHGVEKVIIALPMQAIRKISNVVKMCEHEGIATDIVPDFFKFIQPRTRVENFAGLPMVSVRFTPVDSLAYRVGKRIFDIVFSAIMLLLSAPLLLLIAVAIKLTSPGPVFFVQERMGANRKPFRMIKFRTMKVGSEKFDCQAGLGIRNDPRATRLGKFLRKWSLDELPQFWNVLIGDMSVVGPRPERTFHAQQFKNEVPNYMIRHQVKTGITGWAQANGWRGDTSIAKRVEYDIFYIENWTFWFDLKIIGMTLFRGLVNNNA
ncbi:MAG: undecaprenyl-phosphate glucose phosphotransferase [candidate division KSB1 bacterium]|nr:undecaprenyl-phosphate glucose phosphotransferase [candidate division KSB1 bacterium]MDZ7367821.1 undecaprenyl-phosphate glucose phosphotransferase [candidate division KSB1 bacterium]MDZ7405497.1 undecaprenyl-phosphate glucose phosphotransferase [candidate division KSB1 bacterium]